MYLFGIWNFMNEFVTNKMATSVILGANTYVKRKKCEAALPTD